MEKRVDVDITNDELLKEIIKKILYDRKSAERNAKDYTIDKLRCDFELSIIRKHVGNEKWDKLIDELSDKK